MSIKDQIKAANDQRIIPVECSEWKDENGNPIIVYVKSLNAWDKECWVAARAKNIETNTTGSLATSLLVKCCTDAEGNLLFTDDDIEWLNTKNGKVIDRLYNVASDLIISSQAEVQDLLKKNQ
jgi:hypothetical protein